MHLREPRRSCSAAIVLQRSSKERTVPGCVGWRSCSSGAGLRRPGGGRASSKTVPAPLWATAPGNPNSCRKRNWKTGRRGNRAEKGKKKKNQPCLTGSSLWIERAQRCFGTRPGVRAWDIYISPSCLRGGWGWGTRLGKKEKENKLHSPLNIHDSSFAKANGKHINPFTTLLNAKKMDEGHSTLWGKLRRIWKSGPQEVGIQESRARHGFYLDPFQ